MDPNKFTQAVHDTLTSAANDAKNYGHPEVTSLHILQAMLSDFDGLVVQILKGLDVKVGELSQKLDTALSKISKVDKVDQDTPRKLSAEAQSVVKHSLTEAKNLGDEYISREHLLLSLLSTDCQASYILSSFPINSQKVKSTLIELRSNRPNDLNPEGKYNVLKKYTINLTDYAREGRLDPVVGRDEEIRRVMQILSRRTKNNPVLIGDPGVGKTAIVEGLAQRIVAGDVPETLRGKQLLSLDLASLLAGAKYRGEFEDRLKSVIKELEGGEQYLLFMDELHTLVGAGGAEGAIDAANILKPPLARGSLHAIGATTVKEYRLYIEKDAALERRFQPVFVDQPTLEDTIAILRGLKERYELHHGVRILDDAIISAVNLSIRYIPDRFLPDKAIDLIDEATSAVRMDINTQPTELDALKRRVTQIEIELAALKREKEEVVAARRASLESELANLRDQVKAKQLLWNSQKDIIKAIQTLRATRDKLRLELETAERDVQLEQAAQIKYGQLPEVERKLLEAEKKWADIPSSSRLMREEVTAEDIARVVARWTGVPVSRLTSGEADKLAHLEAELGRRVVGQKEAIVEVANAIRRSRAGISEENRPIASFLFLGPTGVGKTETAKSLAEVLFANDSALVRIDLSEYQEAHSVARLIGSPPGYVGHDEGGQLTEAIRRKPYSIILFDEVEKAHPDVFNLFLQILDDGRLTDSRGRAVNFKNTCLIMTSNLGSDIISTGGQDVQPKLWELLRSTFRPEFLNRIDQIIVFDPLSLEHIERIVDLQLQRVQTRLDRQNITLKVDTDAKKLLAKFGYDPVFGARPLKRAIQDHILDELALRILEGKTPPATTVHVSVDNGKIILK